MRKFSFGAFGLFILLGNQLGSMFGIAIAICVWMILDGLIEEFQKRKPKEIKTHKKEETK
jgi:hypothetical protein